MTIPPALLDSLQNIKGFDKTAFLEVHYSGEQNTSIRINPNKLSDGANLFLSDIDQEALTISPVPWSSNGYYLSARPSFTLDPFFHGGAYYVQEASSMFLEEVMKQSIDLSQSLKVLDLCAAPGGKSTLIQSLISANSVLVSNEVIKSRVTILSENIAKWGASNVVVTNNDPKDFQRLPGYFDMIVVDAPCSGSGLFRKDPNAITEWSEQNVELCSQRQQRILTDILPALKEEGILIYSTCSYSKQENEAIGDWLINEQQLTKIDVELKNEWNIIPTLLSESGALGYRFYPDKLKGEGFFIAAFKKAPIGNDCPPDGKSKGKLEKLGGKEIEILKPWLKNVEDFFFIKQKDDVIALPLHLEGSLGDIQKALYIKRAGIRLGVIIRNELIPAHELALSDIMSNSLSTVDVDKETALQYLRRQDIILDLFIKGWVIITYKKLPLGWIKVLPNRFNNYYPKEWRILNK